MLTGFFRVITRRTAVCVTARNTKGEVSGVCESKSSTTALAAGRSTNTVTAYQTAAPHFVVK